MSLVANWGGAGEEKTMKKLAVRATVACSGLFALMLAGGANMKFR